MGPLLHARQTPPDGQAAGGLTSIAPGIGGSAVAAPTGQVDNSGLEIDSEVSDVGVPTFPPTGDPRVSASSPLVTESDAPSPTDDSASSASPSAASNKTNSTTTTIVIAVVAAVAFLLIGGAILILFYRSNKRTKRRQSRRGHWREIDSHQSHGGQEGALPGRPSHKHSASLGRPLQEGVFETKSMYSARTDAPPSLNLTLHTGEPLMSTNPFANPPSSPVPPVPSMPTLQHVQQPQQPMVQHVQHQADPPSAGFTAPSEYTASYIRSVYSSTGDVHSIAESNHTAGTHPTPRSRSNTLKRAPDRAKNQHELIALDNLIAALDLNDKDQQQQQQQQQGLPDPSLFRAALGGPAPTQQQYHQY